MSNTLDQYYAYSDENIIDWSTEAEGVIRDINAHVTEATVSHILPATPSEAYINLTTLEHATVCIRVNAEGLRIVGSKYDTTDQEGQEGKLFETPYALLSDISKSYVGSFATCLTAALNRSLRKEPTDGGSDSEHLSDAD